MFSYEKWIDDKQGFSEISFEKVKQIAAKHTIQLCSPFSTFSLAI